MLIDYVEVKNYRSLLSEKLYLENLTALVGANGAGKSTFLKALEIFYASAQTIKQDDYYNKDSSSHISISVAYKNLSDEAKELFSPYLQDGGLVVELEIGWNEGRPSFKYHGSSLQNPDFVSIRNVSGANEKKASYAELRKQEKYNSLPAVRSGGAVVDELAKWENENIAQCVRLRDDGQFFGFKSVAKGYLGKFSQFLFIPAVRDAIGDAEDAKNSTFSRLMDLVVKSVISRKQEYIDLKSATEEKYKEIMNPEKLTELNVLQEQMNETIKTFVPNASIGLNWLPLGSINMPPPLADIKLIEDGFESSVEKTGHGLQRAFILTLLQHLAMEQVKANDNGESTSSTLPTLILAIEEPEIYQHPNRQRHLAKILKKLAHGKTPGVAENTQVLYCTHSPHFVGIDRIDQIRLFRKVGNEGKPKITKVISTNLDDVANSIWESDGSNGQKFDSSSLIPRLHAIMTPWMNEGFFSDVNILVEGEDDRAAILGIAKANGCELEGDGFSVIPCGGKNSIDRPYIIFTKLGIPTYIIWDGDFGKGETSGECKFCGKVLDNKAKPEENKKLLRLVGRSEEEWPSHIDDKSACFKDKLETTLCEEIGSDVFEKCLQECQKEYGISTKKHAIKNPNVITDIINKAKEQGKTSKSLEEILKKILMLKNQK
jgi:predicted ATP-dependent endonuclease of OLD family